MDDAYKKELQERGQTIADSVKEGFRAAKSENGGGKDRLMMPGGPSERREKKKKSKIGHMISNDLDALGPKPPAMANEVGMKRDKPVQDLHALFQEIDSKKRVCIDSAKPVTMTAL